MKISYFPEGNASMPAIHQRMDIFIDLVDNKEIWRLGGHRRSIDDELRDKLEPMLNHAIIRYHEGIRKIISTKEFLEVNKI